MTWLLFLIFLYLLAVVAFHLYVRYISAQRHNFNPKYPPVIIEPWYCPFVGPVLSLLNMEACMERWRAKYGENFTLLLFGKYVTFVTKYVDLKRYYHAPDEKLSLSRGATVLLGSAYPEVHYIEHHNAVPFIQKIMTPRYLRHMVTNFETVIDDYFNLKNGEFWAEKGDEVVVDFFDFIYRLVLRLNSISFISPRVYKNHVLELIELFMTLDADKSFISPLTHGIKTRLGLRSERDIAWKHWIDLLMPDIERCLRMIENQIEPSDIDIMYEAVKLAKDELEKYGESFTPRLVAYYTYSTFFPAQINTYTTASYMFLAWIQHEHDEVGHRLQEEIDSAPPPGQLTLDYLNSLEYIQASIYEVIRMHTEHLLSFRHASDDYALANSKFIPSGNLVVSPLTRADDLYADPGKFDPERHMKPREEMKADPYRALPFGRGQHPCTGEKYVKMQIKVLLLRLTKLCKMEIMPESINFETTINKNQLVGLCRPTKPVFVKISKRN